MIKTISFNDPKITPKKSLSHTGQKDSLQKKKEQSWREAKDRITAKKSHENKRPVSFETFIGQKHITSVLQKAIDSAHKSNHTLGHILLCWPSGYGKTTLGHIIANIYDKHLHVVTGYAITKPADIISVLTALQPHDILFIDEIHRIKPNIEEILYIAMEDFAIDMVMPDGGSVRIPLQPFTLIGATTKPETMSEPLKNRFVYAFHCVDYNDSEKQQILMRYLDMYGIDYDIALLPAISAKVETVPRKIHSFAIKIRDFLISTHSDMLLDAERWSVCDARLAIKDGWLTTIHQQYLNILTQSDGPVGLRTISLQLGINEDSIEKEIEPLLLKLNLISKTGKWRITNH